jgi:serine/threonine-protein kinase
MQHRARPVTGPHPRKRTPTSKVEPLVSGYNDDPRRYVGKEIDKRYVVKQLIGRGGLGFIYEGTDKTDKGRVAIKIYHRLSDDKLDDPQCIVDEAMHIAKIRHRNLVKIKDAGLLLADKPYVVMEYLNGSDLDKYLRNGMIPVPAINSLMTQVCSGLGALHRVGIIHRDVKPSNIFLTQEGVVKVFDFDISKFRFLYLKEKNKETTGYIHGTLKYFAPELARGLRGYDHRVDIYALGIMMYEFVYGSAPFCGSELDLLHMHINGHPTPPSRASDQSDVPKKVVNIIMRALEKDPNERFANMYEMRDALLKCYSKCPGFITPKLHFGIDPHLIPTAEINRTLTHV